MEHCLNRRQRLDPRCRQRNWTPYSRRIATTPHAKRMIHFIKHTDMQEADQPHHFHLPTHCCHSQTQQGRTHTHPLHHALVRTMIMQQAMIPTSRTPATVIPIDPTTGLLPPSTHHSINLLTPMDCCVLLSSSSPPPTITLQ